MFDRARFINNLDDFVAAHGDALRSLRGRCIRKSWVAWDTADDEWLADEAVILDFGDRRLELVFFQFDQIAVTWNEIDLAARPAWVANWSLPGLEWRPNALPPLVAAVGRPLLDMKIFEILMESGSDERIRSWLLGGIEFRHRAGWLSLYNGLDEARVSADPLKESHFRGHDFGFASD